MKKESGQAPPPSTPKPEVPGGEAAAPDTKEGREAAIEEGEEA